MTLQSLYAKSITHTVIPKKNGRYCVVNNQKGVIYDVVLKDNVRDCTCPHGYFKSSPCCSHIIAAGRTAAGEKGYRVIGIERGDKPSVPHFRLNFNTYLLVEEIDLVFA